MIDTHCHLTYEGIYEHVDQVIYRAAAAGVDCMITVGTTPDDAQRACALAGQFDCVYATVGVHPHEAGRCRDLAAIGVVLAQLANRPKVVALGEMGLDKHYPDPPFEDQVNLLQWQLQLASAYPDLPIIIHNREATDEVLAILKSSGLGGERFIFHCFTGTDSELDAIMAFGAMVSFTGIVTFPSAKSLADCAARVPIDRLMIETDSPYLTPQPHRKVRPNEPCYVPFVARFIAQHRDMTQEAFVRHMDANAERVFTRLAVTPPVDRGH